MDTILMFFSLFLSLQGCPRPGSKVVSVRDVEWLHSKMERGNFVPLDGRAGHDSWTANDFSI